SLVLLFFFQCSGAHRDLHSFPTRRSSDLDGEGDEPLDRQRPLRRVRPGDRPGGRGGGGGRRSGPQRERRGRRGDARLRAQGRVRSEEHTSELQSLAYLVCRLLLEKKKKKK